VTLIEGLAAVLLTLGSVLVLWAIRLADRLVEEAPGTPDAVAEAPPLGRAA
jgi:hypothetical protein